jgi:hypothetical protein
MGAAILLMVLVGSALPTEGASRLERPGTIGISGYGSFGWITGQSRYGLDFNTGFGLGLTLRYVTSPHWAVGLNFQQQNFGSNSDAVPAGETAALDQFTFTDILFNLYYYRERKSDASQYMVLGAGFYRPEVKYSDGTTSFPGENLILQGGLGIELFIRETFALDLSGQAYGVFGDGYNTQEKSDPDFVSDGSFSVVLAGQVGILFYILK